MRCREASGGAVRERRERAVRGDRALVAAGCKRRGERGHLGEALGEEPPGRGTGRNSGRVAQRGERHARVAPRVGGARGEPGGALAERRDRAHQAGRKVDREGLLGGWARHGKRVREQTQHELVSGVREIDRRGGSLVLDPHATLRARRPPEHGIVGGGERGREVGVRRDERGQFGADLREASEVRVVIVLRRALALFDDRCERGEGGLLADDRLAREDRLRGRELEGGVTAEGRGLPVRGDERAQTAAEGGVERADGLVVERHRRDAMHGRSTRELEHGFEARPLSLGRAHRALQVNEVLEDLGGERRELHHDPGGEVARIEREVAPTEPRRTAERARDVPDGGEMRHLLDRDAQDDLPPASHGLGFGVREPIFHTALQAERRVEVGAHQVVLELCGLVEEVEQVFAAGGVAHREMVPEILRIEVAAALADRGGVTRRFVHRRPRRHVVVSTAAAGRAGRMAGAPARGAAEHRAAPAR